MADTRYFRTTHHGKRVDRWTKQALEACERELGYDLTITQGSFNTSVGASAGTHAGGGTVDLKGWDADRKVRVLRKWGFAAWKRTPSQGPWPTHVHAVLIGNQSAAASARRQVDSYRAGRNGLASNGRDDGPRVTVRTFRYQERLYAPGRRVLKLGRFGPDVEWVQRHPGVKAAVVDGDYGPQTAAAVRAYQESKGIKTSAEVGPRTWLSLLAAARRTKK